MKHIYLEWKPVTIGIDTGYYHMYLVLRDEPTDPGQLTDLSWRSSGEVIRGGPGSGVAPTLAVQTGLLQATLDAYSSQNDINSRFLIDITGTADADSLWTELLRYAAGINSSGYLYEPPAIFDHVANSNATIFSVLNSAGIDVRTILGGGNLFPGAVSFPTLLGSAESQTIIAASQLESGTALLGRDNVDDILIGTKYADKYFGEQGLFTSYSATYDTVCYERAPSDLQVPGGVTVSFKQEDLSSNPLATEPVGVYGTNVNPAEADLLYGVEKVLLSGRADTVAFTGGLQSFQSKFLADGGKAAIRSISPATLRPCIWGLPRTHRSVQQHRLMRSRSTPVGPRCSRCFSGFGARSCHKTNPLGTGSSTRPDYALPISST